MEENLEKYRALLQLAKELEIPIQQSEVPKIYFGIVVNRELSQNAEFSRLLLDLGITPSSIIPHRKSRSTLRTRRQNLYSITIDIATNKLDTIQNISVEEALRDKTWDAVKKDAQALAILIYDIFLCWNRQPHTPRKARKITEAMVENYVRLMEETDYNHTQIKQAIVNYSKWHEAKKKGEAKWFYPWPLEKFLYRHDKTIDRCHDWDYLTTEQNIPKPDKDSWPDKEEIIEEIDGIKNPFLKRNSGTREEKLHFITLLEKTDPKKAKEYKWYMEEYES